jgi:hypothetical protein
MNVLNDERQPTDTCLLCNQRPATQRNSHIIPKFFAKGIFEGTNPRHGTRLSIQGDEQSVQDIVKENYLFCPVCEKGISVLETYCIRGLDKFNDIQYFNSYKTFKRGEFEYFECKILDIKIFNLFIYSIVWRASISNDYAFIPFKLIESDEEQLRVMLQTFLEPTQTALCNKLSDLKELPNHKHVMIRPKKKLRPPHAGLSAVSSSDKSIHQLYLIDYLILYLTKPDKLVDALKVIDNNNLDNAVRVGLSDRNQWEIFNSAFMSKFVK